MTLVLALSCADGLLLASDSQETVATSGQRLKAKTDKIFAPWPNMAVGAAGRTDIITPVRAHLEGSQSGYFQNQRLTETKKRIQEATSKALKVVANNYVPPVPPQGLDARFVFIGYADQDPFIYEIAGDGLGHDHLARGYTAVGSGDIFPYFALAGLEHFDVANRSILEAKLIVYRIMQDAINSAALGIGPPIQMVEVTKQRRAGSTGQARKLLDGELDEIEAAVTAWKAVEGTALTEFIGLRASNPP